MAQFDHLCVRDATINDLAALTRLKASPALHRDRLRDAAAPSFRYLVLERVSNVIGFACLVFVRPSGWSDANDTAHLPQITRATTRSIGGSATGSFKRSRLLPNAGTAITIASSLFIPMHSFGHRASVARQEFTHDNQQAER